MDARVHVSTNPVLRKVNTGVWVVDGPELSGRVGERARPGAGASECVGAPGTVENNVGGQFAQGIRIVNGE